MRYAAITLFCLVLVAVPLCADVAIDTQVSVDSQSAASSIISPAISTNSGNELLLAFVSTDALSSKMTVTGVTGGGLTWTLVVRTNAQSGTSEIWRAFAISPLTNATVTASLSQKVSREHFGHKFQWRRYNRFEWRGCYWCSDLRECLIGSSHRQPHYNKKRFMGVRCRKRLRQCNRPNGRTEPDSCAPISFSNG